MAEINWQAKPEPHDYPAAFDYLTLVLDETTAKKVVKALRSAPDTARRAKDILRASGLVELGPDNPHVRADLRKIHRSEPLSPILLVRGDAAQCRPLVVADGFHRLCAAHLVDENAEIPCRLVTLPS